MRQMIMIIMSVLLLFGCTSLETPDASKYFPSAPIVELIEVTSLGCKRCKYPEQRLTWTTPPFFINCEESSLFDTNEVELWMQFWTDRGAPKMFVGEAKCRTECKWLPGLITITNEQCGLKEDPKASGVTKLRKTPDGHISGAIIEIRKHDTQVLMHEVAHSLGWTHCKTPGHLMNPILSNGGWDTTGMYNDLVPEK